MGKVLVLRTCDKNGRSYGGFRWPQSGPVECPDWNPTPVCGGGLHGLLWGEGYGVLLDWSEDALWQIVEVEGAEIVKLRGQVKYPRGVVLHTGDRRSATEYLLANGGAGRAVVGATVTAGDGGQATAGDDGQAAAGNGGRATAGDGGQATAGNDGQATAGNDGQATAGDCGQATAGYGGRATAGNDGQATAGDDGQATAGDDGQATAGCRGQATAGCRGQATAGYGGQAAAGNGGQIAIRWWDAAANRLRLAVGYVGENGILPNARYRVNDSGQFIPANE